MMNSGPMHFYTGVPNSKTATLPSIPRKGKAAVVTTQKPGPRIKLFLWGGFTAEIKRPSS